MRYTEKQMAAIVRAAEKWAKAEREYLTRLVDGSGDGRDVKSKRLRHRARTALGEIGAIFSEAWGRKPRPAKPARAARVNVRPAVDRKLQRQLDASSSKLDRDLRQQTRVSDGFGQRVVGPKSKPARAAARGRKR